MKAKENKSLTLKELVAVLHKLGLTDVKERRIIDWKEKSLLPPFDAPGRGLGKGKGKEAGRWGSRRLVIEQAVWIYRLLRIYRYAGNIYLPLWMLGFSVPIKFVREDLTSSLKSLIKLFEKDNVKAGTTEDEKEDTLEDYIGDLVFKQINTRKIPEIFRMPLEVAEIPINIFFNPDYKIDDGGFEDGVSSLAEWKETFEQEIMPQFTKGLIDNSEIPTKPIEPAGIELFFENAAFFQQHLSVPRLRQCVCEASEEDFLQVQEDMKVVQSIAEGFSRFISIMMKNIADFDVAAWDQMLRLFFQFSNLIVLADISMRRSGWSERLNWARGEIIKKVREDFNEETEKALLKESPAFANAIDKGIKVVSKNFESWMVNEHNATQKVKVSRNSKS